MATRYRPNRIPTDANTYLYYDLQETAAPFVNQGSAGTALNLVDVTGSGTGYQAGVAGAIFGEKGLALSGDAADAAIRADGTDAWLYPEITVAVWVTISDYVQENDIRRVFFKAWSPTSWVNPWDVVGIDYFSSGNIGAILNAGGVYVSPPQIPRDLATLLSVPHLLGLTYDGTTTKLWVDGLEVVSRVNVAPLTNALGTGPWCIGNYPSGGSSPLGGVGNAQKIGGIIEEVRVDIVARDAAWWQENWERGTGWRTA